MLMSHILVSAVTNMAPVRHFETESDEFNVGEICTSGSYEQTWITKLYYY